ncbi:MAG: hypothetical protein P1U64_01470 [Alcanivoracaceae bacterium]|nr:hypothetical protein [Alcanivoracaceae bacterium]
MSESQIVRLFFVKMKPEFFALTEGERADYMAKDRKNLDELGMKAISMINLGDTSEEWDYVGVEGWPSIEAINEREAFENEVLKISKYTEFKTIVGTQESFEDYGK